LLKIGLFNLIDKINVADEEESPLCFVNMEW